jgi:hypothetical protein
VIRLDCVDDLCLPVLHLVRRQEGGRRAGLGTFRAGLREGRAVEMK